MTSHTEPVPSLSLQLENGLDSPSLGNIKTSLLRITVGGDDASTKSDFQGLDVAQLPHDLFTFINRVFGFNHLPPYFAPNLKRFLDVDDMIQHFLTSGTVVWVLLRDATEGSFSPSDFVAVIGLSPYHHPEERPDPIKEPHSSWHIYIEPNDDNNTALPVVLKSLGVDQSLHGYGLGKFMLNVFEREAIARARLASRSHALLSMTTMSELNEAFYKRLGWATTRRYVHQPGYIGNTVPVTAVQMEKLLEVK